MLMRVIFILLLLVSGGASASLTSQQGLPAQYMQTTEDAAIWAQVGNAVVNVGNVRAGQILAVFPAAADYYEFRFGFGTGFIDKEHLEKVQGKQRVEDRLNQTWFQIRIGNRLAWISSLDAQEDNGLPILTYHHILRDEENTRFRHTSTTTSVRAFNNQMAWLRDQDYTTLTMYQLEGYVRNKMNLPAKAVVITFDDGLKSVSRYAYPVLKEYGFNATAFIISSRIKGHPQKWDPRSLQFMSVQEIKGIQDVFDIQSHTHFLHRVDGYKHPILLSRSYHVILFDFERSRRALAQFNPRVLYVSYPFGGYDNKAIKAANDAGFHLAVTTVKGKVKPGDNPFLLKRLYILRTDSLETMSRLISNQPQG
ncbi:TPA: polysaccharide deacetylase family protein [Enterobacter hormaechei subsp. steigerwaltii]|nr:polysaccharide deacetylase family protein [Enterobacter hormaechei subsp. steigerwaltii]